MKRFALIVEYGTGKVCMPVDTLDLVDAGIEFKRKYVESMGGTSDKSCHIPPIFSMQIVPMWYDSTYKKGE